MHHDITPLASSGFADAVEGLAAVLADAVEGGASLGFLAPFGPAEAAAWWRDRAPSVEDGSLRVWAVHDGAGLCGTVSLGLEHRANGRHRAEVTKLIVHRRARGRGLAGALLTTAEQAAAAAGATLLLLDTESGSAAEGLYLHRGWTRHGTVPGFATDPAGRLRDGSFFHKPLTTADASPASGAPA